LPHPANSITIFKFFFIIEKILEDFRKKVLSPEFHVTGPRDVPASLLFKTLKF
jgi:hypothetical protein